jgi:hypothetical protein
MGCALGRIEADAVIASLYINIIIYN